MSEPTGASPSQIVSKIMEKHPPGQESLVPVLQDIQEEYGYLTEDAVAELSKRIGLSENEIYGVATFFKQFRFRPPGEHSLHVCLGTACHVRGGRQVMDEVQRRLKVEPGETTEDGTFDLERVACVGCCALAPVVVVDGEVHPRMMTKKVQALIKNYRNSKDEEK